ncbi:hypothetical protein KA005_28130, partial [bacterium]|nr:hypothetical protein [bacterium]
MENRAKDILAKKLAKKEVPQELDVREMNKTAKELVTTDEGQRKLAQMMRPVFKKKMDYLGFARNLAVVEDCSDGAPLWHEKDYTDIPAVRIG